MNYVFVFERKSTDQVLYVGIGRDPLWKTLICHPQLIDWLMANKVEAQDVRTRVIREGLTIGESRLVQSVLIDEYTASYEVFNNLPECKDEKTKHSKWATVAEQEWAAGVRTDRKINKRLSSEKGRQYNEVQKLYMKSEEGLRYNNLTVAIVYHRGKGHTEKVAELEALRKQCVGLGEWRTTPAGLVAIAEVANREAL